MAVGALEESEQKRRKETVSDRFISFCICSKRRNTERKICEGEYENGRVMYSVTIF